MLFAMVDRTWFSLMQPLPDWDQADYLTGAMNYWKALQTPQWLSRDWWVSLWLLSSKIPPLVYIATVPFLNLFGTGIAQSTLVNLLYSGILLVSVYGIAATLFTAEAGLWSAALCLVIPGLYPLRLSFLLDHPVVAMTALSFWALTVWWKGVPQKVFIPQSQADESATESGSDATIEDQETADPDEIETKELLQSLRQAIAQSEVTQTALWWDCICSIGVWMRKLLPTIGLGVAVGLAFLTKQTVLLFLFVPLLYVFVAILWKRRWLKLLQFLLSGLIAGTIAYPWYRTNWLLILTSGERATVESAIAEGDPALNTIDAWIYYLKLLPELISYPLLIVSIVGLVLYSHRIVHLLPDRFTSAISTVTPRELRSQQQKQWLRSIGWLLIFLGGSYFLCSLNVNKDLRYFSPALPIGVILLTQGLMLFPRSLWEFRWGTVGLLLVLMVTRLFPIVPGTPGMAENPQRGNWHQQDVVTTVLETDPYLRSTIGVLPSIPQLNQHNVNYFGTLQNFQVYGRQVGAREKQVWQDSRSLDWYLTKTGDQGAIRKPIALANLTSAIERNPNFQTIKTWSLPDGSELNLYHRSRPKVTVEEASTATPNNATGNAVQLLKVTLPKIVSPNQPVPVEYQWLGSWEQLRSGIVVLTWKHIETPTQDPPESNSIEQSSATTAQIVQQPAKPADRWMHDHGIGLGLLQSSQASPETPFKVTETLAMLPPQTAAGTYQLEAVYLDRNTEKSYPIAIPETQVIVNPAAASSVAPGTVPEIDPVTRLRLLATLMPQGFPAMDQVFDQVGRLNLYDPTQDYLLQAKRSLEYRLQQEPQNLQLLYTYALAQALRRNVEGAITAMTQVAELDSKNPNAYAYLAVVNLYDFRGRAAQTVLQNALQLMPQSPELHGLNAIASLMQGHVIQAWNEAQIYLQRNKKS